ncbi:MULTISPECIES: bifunctional glycosyltransferase family 2 protein/class I SAM-dependent methyltransferase [Bacillus]|uniref:bifunctional glycosyltransferase family 2 protein/class I SAM-dependent methyltransferase n=1 Tax=Bacillus TaxID=1386 RepID=UPI0023F00EDA|nr:bifunctional glycosyltransferase family 2 protein/class I SAM-dependent methyltransferase [Bacillus sp. (in: firmicutes)]
MYKVTIKAGMPVKTSIIILTYNELELTKKCLASIERYTDKDKIELIIVDNGSSDGTREYISNLPDVKVILNEKNLGFAKGCNQGIEAAGGENLLFLNNDTMVTKNWLTSMLRVLYHSEKAGMVGPVSNYVSGAQMIHDAYQSLDELESFAEAYCAREKHHTKRVLRLVGFCLLVKKSVIEDSGPFDEQFGYGSFEDDDLCLRALQKGYSLHIALDAFVHHHGHATFTANQDININQLYSENRQRFTEKWGTDFTYFTHPRPEIAELVPREAKRILDVGCGAGATGLELQNRQPCELYGIELHPLAAQAAKGHYEAVLQEDVEKVKLPYPEGFFDCIIFADILEHLKDPWRVIETYSSYLSPAGSIVCSIPNISHAEALFPLLLGDWTYRDAGILDRTHLRFFTPQTVRTLFPEETFDVKKQSYTYVHVDERVQLFLQEITRMAQSMQFPVTQLPEQSRIYQILLRVEKTR